MPAKTVVSAKTPKYLRPVNRDVFTIETTLKKTPIIMDKRKRFTIGRLPSNDLCIDMKTVSDLHASIKWKKTAFMLIDEASTNGIFVNGKRVQKPVQLKDGDKIKIGRIVLKFKAEKAKKKTSRKSTKKTTAKKTTKKTRKTASKTARKSTAKKTARKSARKSTTKKTARKTARKSAAKKTTRKATKKTAQKKGTRKTARKKSGSSTTKV